MLDVLWDDRRRNGISCMYASVKCSAASRVGSNMIVTSNDFRALLFNSLIVAFPRTGCEAMRRWGKSQWRAAKALTVAHFQADSLYAHGELLRQFCSIVGGVAQHIRGFLQKRPNCLTRERKIVTSVVRKSVFIELVLAHI